MLVATEVFRSIAFIPGHEVLVVGKKRAIVQNGPPRLSPPKGTECTMLNEAPAARRANQRILVLQLHGEVLPRLSFPVGCGFVPCG